MEKIKNKLETKTDAKIGIGDIVIDNLGKIGIVESFGSFVDELRVKYEKGSCGMFSKNLTVLVTKKTLESLLN